MQFNSPQQMDLARRVLRSFDDSWERMLEHATLGDDGVLYLQKPCAAPAGHGGVNGTLDGPLNGAAASGDA